MILYLIRYRQNLETTVLRDSFCAAKKRAAKIFQEGIDSLGYRALD